MGANLDRLFLDYSTRKLTQLGSRVEECLARLSAEQVWARSSQNQNAIGNLVLHLCGNVRQWIVSAVGGAPDFRDRDREFATRGEVEPAELSKQLRDAVGEAVRVLAEVPAGRLSDRMTIQSYDVSVLEAIYHVVEHFSGHTGQIIFATKWMTGSDFDHYRHLNQAGAHGESTP